MQVAVCIKLLKVVSVKPLLQNRSRSPLMIDVRAACNPMEFRNSAYHALANPVRCIIIIIRFSYYSFHEKSWKHIFTCLSQSIISSVSDPPNVFMSNPVVDTMSDLPRLEQVLGSIHNLFSCL